MCQESSAQNYRVSASRLIIASATSSLLEAAQSIPNIHDVMPEPFDVTNHAGNMWGGALIATSVAYGYALKDGGANQFPTIPQESMSHFRKRGVAAIMGTTALVNCVTETKWGVQHLPVAEWLNGTTPDVLDTVYSTVWSGILSLALWKKTK